MGPLRVDPAYLQGAVLRIEQPVAIEEPSPQHSINSFVLPPALVLKTTSS